MGEMAGTIKMLSARGDMYAQAATARQDLEGERLTVQHLRDDVDSYRLGVVCAPWHAKNLLYYHHLLYNLSTTFLLLSYRPFTFLLDCLNFSLLLTDVPM